MQLWILWNKFPTPTSTSARKAQKLKREMIQLKRELNAVSPQQDFANWAKLDRKYNKAEAEFKKLGAHPIYPPRQIYMSANLSSRRISQNPPSDLRFDRLHPPLARHPRPALRATILVLEIAHVLDARGLGAILRRVGLELPARAPRQRQHQHLGYRMRKHDHPRRRGTAGCVGAGYEETGAGCGCGEGGAYGLCGGR